MKKDSCAFVIYFVQFFLLSVCLKEIVIMKKLFICLFISTLALTCGNSQQEQLSSPPRFANGIVIKGELLETTSEGLVIETRKGKKIYPWKYLSAGTRFRYQSGPKESTPSAVTNSTGALEP